MGFLMDGLEAEAYDRTYDDRELVRRILTYFRPKLPAMWLVAAMIVLTSLMQSALLVLGILASGVLAWVFNFARQIFSARVVGNVVLNLRRDAFAAVLRRDMSF